ncbi:MAG: restriction endonuclease, partial [Acetobacterales bacterium]
VISCSQTSSILKCQSSASPMPPVPDWRTYERVAACFEVEAAGMDATVLPNASLLGRLSGVKRQIDILVDARWPDDQERRVIYDAKLRKRKIDVKDIEAFEGLMRDVGASRGVIVCSNGHTKAALARAQQIINIRLLSGDEALELDHAAIDSCPLCKIEARKTQGLVFWDGQFPIPVGFGWAIIFTGKCDVCHSFAFWCWDCGEQRVVPDGEAHICGCERTWFVEKDENEASFILRCEDGEVSLDRRPLR